MSYILHSVRRLALRWRYPGALPEEIVEALGISLADFSSFEQFVKLLSDPLICRPTKLYRFMPREQAEAVFSPTAQHTERFHRQTLCSYYFYEGWLEFVLQFDQNEKLRRIWMQHKLISQQPGIEIYLP